MRSRMHGRRRCRTEDGAVAVEFALVLIPLLMIVAGIINFGFVFAQQLALDNAVRQAARAGVVDTPSGRTLEDIVNQEFSDTALGRGRVGTLSITYPTGSSTCEDSAFGDSLTVRAEGRSDFIFPWPLPESVMSGSITLRSEAEFQCEYS